MISRSLSFTHQLEPGEAEVVVVANGCTDDTAHQARGLPDVTVLELSQSGKVGALNAGDRLASAFPRIYLDADVYLTASTLRALAEALTLGRPAIGSPRVIFETRGRPWVIRAFYHVYRQLPYAADGMSGGVYGVSAEGWSRFRAFPDVMGDDLYVQRMFDSTERITIEAPFVVETPRTLATLLKIRTRAAYGNRQLAASGGAAFASSTATTVKALARLLLRRPGLVPAAVIFIAVTAEARRQARRDDGLVWHRDSTTR